MSNEIETIDLDEELDYELDMDMDQRHEDALLNEEECGEEHENDLVTKMSMTSVSSVEPVAIVTPTEPLPTPCYSNVNDFWGKSISTFSNVLQSNATEPTNKAVEPLDTSKKHIDFNHIQQPVIEVFPTVEPQQVVLDDKRENVAEPEKLEIKLDMRSPSPDPEGLSQSEATSSSSSTSSSKKFDSKRNKNKSKTRRFVSKGTVLHKGPVRSKNRIPSLMSIKTQPTQLAFPRTRFPLLIQEHLPTQAIRKKVPFIIKAQASGNSISRTVTVNPEFEGFTSATASNTDRNGSTQLSTAVSNSYFNNVVINKRRSTTSLETISKIDKKATEPATPMSIDTGEMSVDDKNYLMAIEEQKKKREEVLRQKEWKRDMEGWQFLDD
ncbi:uncharacterized protein LOC119067129 isoform X2 [Bradysia coprophila]|uniref:uncharacterized protein LOC119067129 isoform X2 n=1 Tax=Bradysia coprophila TaxID=38358 RepID=UPI00187D992C|nr:uncharacterized protein LOC119067129 isoform X2 [Bradysia coprophila]